MRIQHNIMAMNAYRNYNTNTSALSKNLEKLASGYKINRAGDDAAGLAISEKMRAQITGLNAAQKNVKDGISLVKTAEGAMQEIQDMLNRMDYLATQSANGTYQDEVDREALQQEVGTWTTCPFRACGWRPGRSWTPSAPKTWARPGGSPASLRRTWRY